MPASVSPLLCILQTLPKLHQRKNSPSSSSIGVILPELLLLKLAPFLFDTSSLICCVKLELAGGRRLESIITRSGRF